MFCPVAEIAKRTRIINRFNRYLIASFNRFYIATKRKMFSRFNANIGIRF